MTQQSAAAQRATARRPVRARDIMQGPVLAATPHASLRDIAIQLVTNHYTGMPVAVPDGRVVGVISDADLVRTLREGKQLENLTATDVMTSPPVTVDGDVSFEVVMAIIEARRLVRGPGRRSLPVAPRRCAGVGEGGGEDPAARVVEAAAAGKSPSCLAGFRAGAMGVAGDRVGGLDPEAARQLRGGVDAAAGEQPGDR